MEMLYGKSDIRFNHDYTLELQNLKNNSTKLTIAENFNIK